MSVPSPVTSFGCDVEAVEKTVRSLNKVLDELENFSRRDTSALASKRVSEALDDFHDDSSDQREKVTGSVKAVAQMLQGLVDGIREVDRALAGSLPDDVRKEATRPDPGVEMPGPVLPPPAFPQPAPGAQMPQSAVPQPAPSHDEPAGAGR